MRLEPILYVQYSLRCNPSKMAVMTQVLSSSSSPGNRDGKKTAECFNEKISMKFGMQVYFQAWTNELLNLKKKKRNLIRPKSILKI